MHDLDLSKMTLKDALDETKLDLTNLICCPSGGFGTLYYEFDMSARNFLKFAKQDLQEEGTKGLINALSNSKRAIDCQIDQTLHSLGVDYSKLPKSLEPVAAYFKDAENAPYKLKIMRALNLAPTSIISKVRTLRNKLEHYYEVPTIEEVKESIDIADLFIRSVGEKLKKPTNEFTITDKNNYIEGTDDETSDYKDGLSIGVESHRALIYVHKYENGTLNKRRLYIEPNQPEFFGIITLMNSMDDDFDLTEFSEIL
jgi:hypothetical protein